MIIVSDTSPITNLAAIQTLNLLESLYGSIIIPVAVYKSAIAQNQPQQNYIADVRDVLLHSFLNHSYSSHAINSSTVKSASRKIFLNNPLLIS